jgi:hypothetical protein
MRNRTAHTIAHASIAIATAALAVACSGGTDAVENERKAQSGGQRGQYETVKVEGCIQGAPGTPGREYILAHATMAEPETQPQGQETMEHGPLVTPGSWVRLSPGSIDLKDYVGQRVAVTGEVMDRGNNTLGTSGRENPKEQAMSDHDKFARSAHDAGTNPDRAVPPSTVAPMGANANGNAPQIAVEKVAKLGQSCEGENGRENTPKGK